MFRKVWNYLRTAFGMKAESMMDPAVQIEQAVQEAREQDRELREQAARVIAHRSELQMKLDRGVDAAAKAKSNARAALMKVQAAQGSGDAAGIEKWTRVAQSMAMELEVQEKLVEGLKTQFTAAEGQSAVAKQHVESNALRLKELTTKRMELLGKLEQARMQEQVNKTLEAINQPLESQGPSLGEIEDKINKRMALASAKSELESTSLAGAEREIEATSMQLAGQARLDALMSEMGMTPEVASAPVESAPEPLAAPAAPEADQQLLEEGELDIDALKEAVKADPVEVDAPATSDAPASS